MEVIACGEMGLSIQYFYSLTQRQFYNILKGYRDKEYRKDVSEWERSRFNWYYSLIAMQGTDTIKKPEDVFSFPWEKEKVSLEEVVPKTKEELEEIWSKIDAAKALKNKGK